MKSLGSVWDDTGIEYLSLIPVCPVRQHTTVYHNHRLDPVPVHSHRWGRSLGEWESVLTINRES